MRRSQLNKLKQLLLTVLLCGLLALVTRVPLGSEPQEGAIRLSWRFVGAEVVKQISQAELETLPIHMRPEDGMMTSKRVPYSLVVSLDGIVLAQEQVHPGGLKEDRPLFVFRTFEVEPGDYDLRVQFAADSEEVVEEPLTLEQKIHLEAGQIITVRLGDGPKPRLSL